MPVRIINPETGVSQVVDEADAKYYEGYRPATAEEVASASIAADQARLAADPLMSASAASAGALRGLTLGASDIAVGALAGDETGAGLDALRAQHGAASLAGEVGGALAGSLLLPGSPIGVASRIGEGAGALATRGLARAGMTEGGALTTALGRGLGEAVEGGLFGMGSAVSETISRGEELTAEKLIPEIGLGAGLGLVGGAGSDLLGRLAKASARRLAQAVPGTEDIAGVMGMHAIGARGSDLANIEGGAKAWNAISRDLSEAGVLKSWSKPGEIVEDIARASDEAGAALGELRKRVDGFIEQGNTELRPDLSGFFKRLDERLTAAQDLPPELRARWESAAAQLKPLRDKFEARTAGIVKGRGKDAAPVRGGVTFEDVQKYRQQLDEIVFPKKTTGGLRIQANDADQLREVRGDLENTLEDALFGAAAKMDDAGSIAFRGKSYDYGRAKELFGNLAKARDIVEKRAGNDAGNRLFSLTDNIWASGAGAAGMATMGPLGLLTGPVAGFAANQLRQRLPSAIASRLYKSMPDRGTVDRVAADVLGVRVAGKPLIGPDASGDFLAGIRQAREELATQATPDAARISDSLSRVEAALERAGKDPDAVAAHGKALGALLSGNVGGAQMGRREMRRAIRDLEPYFPPERAEAARAAADSDERALRVVRTLVRGGRVAAQVAGEERLPGGQRKPPPELQRAASNQLLDFARQPADVRTRTIIERSEGLADSLGPSVAGAWAGKMAMIADNLAKRAPRPQRRETSLTPWAEPETIHPLQSARWDSYTRGLSDPISVLDELAAGRVDRDALDAVRENYPARWAEIQAQVSEELLEREDPPNIHERRMLGLVMGQPADPSQTPEVITAAQEAWKPQDDKGGEVDPKMAQSLATDAQRLEGPPA